MQQLSWVECGHPVWPWFQGAGPTRDYRIMGTLGGAVLWLLTGRSDNGLIIDLDRIGFKGILHVRIVFPWISPL